MRQNEVAPSVQRKQPDIFCRIFFTRGRAAAAFAVDMVRYYGQVAVVAGLFFSTQIDGYPQN